MPPMWQDKGYAHFAAAFDPAILVALIGEQDQGAAGRRISGGGALNEWLHEAAAVQTVLTAMGRPQARPVRAVLFDKTPTTNWSLGWHQDRTVCVRARRDVAGYGPFTVKSGLVHVEPPFAIIANMITLRFHLDAVDAGNAPLLVAEGSHRFGKVAVAETDAIVAGCRVHSCHAQAGDVWAYATAILHASHRSHCARRRRVLQVDYSPDDLAGGLEWLGV